jgi:phospholipid transport system substrate-binding protein
MPRLFAATIFVLFTGLSSAFPAAADTGPAEFVGTLGNEALGVIRADMPPAQKQAFFHQLLQQNFDLPGIARFVLGPHWRTASEPEKQEFLRLFEDYIVRVYSEKFAQYRGETLRVTGSRADPEGALVTSEIVRPGGAPPIKVDWRLTARDGLYKISDVIIDGVSMGITERSEIAAMIQRSGGVHGLFAMMREKTAAPAGALPAAVPPALPPPGALPPGAAPPAAFPPGIGAGPPPR